MNYLNSFIFIFSFFCFFQFTFHLSVVSAICFSIYCYFHIIFSLASPHFGTTVTVVNELFLKQTGSQNDSPHVGKTSLFICTLFLICAYFHIEIFAYFIKAFNVRQHHFKNLVYQFRASIYFTKLKILICNNLPHNLLHYQIRFYHVFQFFISLFSRSQIFTIADPLFKMKKRLQTKKNSFAFDKKNIISSTQSLINDRCFRFLFAEINSIIKIHIYEITNMISMFSKKSKSTQKIICDITNDAAKEHIVKKKTKKNEQANEYI